MQRTTSTALLSLLTASLGAQNPCEGNGIGNAYLSTTPMIVNGSGVINVGSPTATNSVGLLLWGNAAGPAIPFCLDTSLFFFSQLVVLDGSGNATVTINATPTNFPTTLFAKGLILEGNFDWSLSKTALVSVEYSDSWRETGSLAQARSLHTATALHGSEFDNVTGALVAGGATGSLVVPTALDSTEVYDPLNRVFTTGPTMSVARARHAAVRMPDGKVLLCGGMTNAASLPGGPATATCELYDPTTNSLQPFPSMLQPRLAHALTLLPDGRLLASGGFADWTDAGNNFAARLNTALDSTEVWDPTTNAWTAGPTMAAPRGGHSQTQLDDGRLLIVGGVRGGTLFTGSIEVPWFTASCELFDPTTNALAPASSTAGLVNLRPRAFHGASRLPNGNVLITGGSATTGVSIGTGGIAGATDECWLYDPAADQWAFAGNLPSQAAFHRQVTNPQNGSAIVTGGAVGDFSQLLGTDSAAAHDGIGVTALATVGNHPVLSQTPLTPSSHALIALHDGTILLTGGYLSALPGGGETARCLLYMP